MKRTWLIDGRGFAKKVKNATDAFQIKDCGASRECPICHYRIDNSDIVNEWPVLPAGVKFDPSDVELLEHLAAKIGVGNSKPHVFIDDFIPTLEGDEGICSSHPENLPGAIKDGSSVHFFYRMVNAYANGQRKCRKICDPETSVKAHVRWHKTGKTKPVYVNGVQIGYKKILVLYANSKKGPKPEKCNWVMHQYHLGTNEDEKEGQYVVSKIFYRPRKEIDKNETSLVIEESDLGSVDVIPSTPKTDTPYPPRPENTSPSDVAIYDYSIRSLVQEVETLKESSHSSSKSQSRDKMEHRTCLDGESDAVELGRKNSLLCKEIIDSYATFDSSNPNNALSTQVARNRINANQRDDGTTWGISDLENLDLDTPLDFPIAYLRFASQDSIFDQLN